MRCLLGMHLRRQAKAPLELAFRALRKWAELRREERARAVLAALALQGRGRGYGSATSLPTVLDAAAEDEELPPSSPSSAPTTITGSSSGAATHEPTELGEGEAEPAGAAASAEGEAAGPRPGLDASSSGDSSSSRAPFELFVSFADYPVEGTWRPPLSRAECLAPPTIPAYMSAGRMATLVRELEVGGGGAVAGRCCGNGRVGPGGRQRRPWHCRARGRVCACRGGGMLWGPGVLRDVGRRGVCSRPQAGVTGLVRWLGKGRGGMQQIAQCPPP